VQEEVAALEAAGSEVVVIRADAEALAAMGDNSLDPSFRAAAVDAGLRQGRAAAGQLRATWTDG
jgi:NTE family protein